MSVLRVWLFVLVTLVTVPVSAHVVFTAPENRATVLVGAPVTVTWVDAVVHEGIGYDLEYAGIPLATGLPTSTHSFVWVPTAPCTCQLRVTQVNVGDDYVAEIDVTVVAPETPTGGSGGSGGSGGTGGAGASAGSSTAGSVGGSAAGTAAGGSSTLPAGGSPSSPSGGALGGSPSAFGGDSGEAPLGDAGSPPSVATGGQAETEDDSAAGESSAPGGAPSEGGAPPVDDRSPRDDAGCALSRPSGAGSATAWLLAFGALAAWLRRPRRLLRRPRSPSRRRTAARMTTDDR